MKKDIAVLTEKELNSLKRSLYFSANRRNANARKVQNLLSSFFCTADDQLNIFSTIDDFSVNVVSPTSLLGLKLFNDKDVLKSASRNSDKTSEIINQVYRLIHGFGSKNKPVPTNRIDFVSFANLVLAPNETTNLVYCAFSVMMSNLCKTGIDNFYISNVSPSFISELASNDELLSELTSVIIIVNSEIQKDLFKKKIPGLVSSQKISLYTIEEFKTLVRVKTNNPMIPQDVLIKNTAYFSGNLISNTDEFIDVSLIAKQIADRFIYIIPDTVFDKVRMTVEQEAFNLGYFAILPTQAFFDKGLVKNIFGCNVSDSQPDFVRYYHMGIGTADKKTYVIFRKSKHELERAVLFSANNKTIRELCRPRPVTSNKEPKGILFCKEFSFWYNLVEMPSQKDNLRISCIAYGSESDVKRTSTKKYPRGTTIKDSQIKKTFNKELYGEYETYVKERMIFIPKLRNAVIAYVKNNFKLSSISVRAAWYCYYILEEDLNNDINDSAILIDYIFSDYSKGIMVSDDSDVLENSILSFASENVLSDSNTDKLFTEVRNIITKAIVNRHIKSNPLDLLKEERNKELRIKRAIRDLAVKSFSIEEEKNIVESSEHLGEYGIAVLIRLFTGLEPSEIAALKIDDFGKIPFAESRYQLFISKKIDGSGNIEWLVRQEECCPIPLMLFLSQKILTMLNKRGISKTSLAQNAFNDEWLFDKEENNRKKVVNTIQKNCLDLEKQLEKNDFNVKIVTSRGSEITNLNEYNRTRFRGTCRDRLSMVCNLNESEIQYLMRTEIADTLYGHYVGMSHPCIQAGLSKKLDRWGRRHQGNISNQFSEQEITASSDISVKQEEETDCSIYLKCSFEGKTALKVSAENGCVVHLQLEEKMQ